MQQYVHSLMNRSMRETNFSNRGLYLFVYIYMQGFAFHKKVA